MIIEAAYSWRMEGQIGSITPGILPNFAILANGPYEVDPLLKYLAVRCAPSTKAYGSQPGWVSEGQLYLI